MLGEWGSRWEVLKIGAYKITVLVGCVHAGHMYIVLLCRSNIP